MKGFGRGAVLVSLACVAACTGPGITPIRTSFNRAVYLHSKGALDQAIDEYREALEQDPDDWRARFNHAMALEQRAKERAVAGDEPSAARSRELAESEYRHLVESGGGALRASINLAAMEFERGDGAAAEARLRGLLVDHPDATMVRTALAAQCLARHDAAGARSLLEEALARDPSNPSANRLLGAASRLLGDRDRARSAYGVALLRDPDDLATLLALGHLELEAGRPDEASSWFARLLLIDPDHAEGHLGQSQAMEANGDLEQATMHLWLARRSGRLEVDEPAVSAHLIELYQRLGERERAQ